MIINVSVRDKHATAIGDPTIVCGNSDYKVKFTFDEEWSGAILKTARFVYNKGGHDVYEDVIFAGDTVDMPVVTNTNAVKIGVFADNIITTTSALVKAKHSIRCETGAPNDPTPSQYDQIIALLEQVKANVIEVDNALSEESTNPVENKVITKALSAIVTGVDEAIETIGQSVSEIGEAVNDANEALDKLSDAFDKAAHTHQNKDVLDQISGFKTINGESIVGVGDIEVDADATTPTFDLVALGLPTVPMDGTMVNVEADTTDIMDALDKGAIKVIAAFGMGASTVTAEVVMGGIHVGAMGVYICSYPFDYEGMKLMFNLVVGDGVIGAYYTDLSGGEEVPTSIDMSGLDANGTIVEIYADGITKTSTMEFDADGNPIKITDGDGNVTTLIW